MSDAVVLVEDGSSQECRLAITAPLGEFSAARGFEFRPIPICLSLREGGRIVGGLIGAYQLGVAIYRDPCGCGASTQSELRKATYGDSRGDRPHAQLRRGPGRHL
jgi:hypothetical protein